MMELKSLLSGVDLNTILGGALGGAVTAIIGAAILVAVILFAALYIYGALALRAIAKRTKHKPLWMAWVPIANIILMLKIAKLQWQWIFAIFLNAIPHIGGWLLLAGMVYVLWKICEVRHRPGWWAVLIVIPGIGPLWYLVLLGILAWSKK